MSNNNIILIYSLLSGDVYEIPEDEFDNLDDFQIPLLKLPNKSCKRCYGRGYIGYDPVKKYYPMCRCIVKHLDRDRISNINLKY